MPEGEGKMGLMPTPLRRQNEESLFSNHHHYYSFQYKRGVLVYKTLALEIHGKINIKMGANKLPCWCQLHTIRDGDRMA